MNKKALITGGSRGIGKGIALHMASLGYDVAITYYSEGDEAEQVAQTIRSAYGMACYVYQAKLEQPGAAAALFEAAIKDLGVIDVLVNNAGRTIFENIFDLKEESLDFLMNLEFKSCVLLAQAAARHMVQHGIRGSIINITSSRSQRAYPGDGIYGGVKAGLMRATESFSVDMAPYGIRINCIAPGATQIRTAENLGEKAASYLETIDKLGRKIPLGRVGQPDDIAKAVAYLSSDDASYITGITLRIDGGLILPGMPEVTRPGADEKGWAWGWREPMFIQQLNNRKE